MRRHAAAVFVAAALAMAGCGGGEDEAATTTAPAITEGATYDVTIEEFILALQPDKTTMIEDFVADNPQDCKAFGESFSVVALSASATEEPPDNPLSEFLLRMCETSY